jgi:predicted O-methyltransferase YrrM
MINIEKENRDFYINKLSNLFNEYITKISSQRMAASLEAISTILTLADKIDPEIILDLGSGFSSVAFRWYCKEKNISPKLISVDTSKEWLDKTIKYCRKLNLPLFEFYIWNEIKHKQIQSDLIFIDLGYSKERPNFYDIIFSNFVTKKSVVVFDDAHKKTCKISQHMVKFRKKEVDIKDLTKDNKRYCRLFYKIVRKT